MQGEPPAASDPDNQALDDLRGRIVMLDNEMLRLMGQRRGLVDEYERRRWGIIARLQGGVAPSAMPFPTGPTAPKGPATAPTPRQEWSGARVRGLLLWLGAALLAISALTFTAVAWSRLGDAGRALLLLGVTVLCAMLAIGARRRLPMTAEAFVGLATVLVLVDVYAMRRAGLGSGMSWQVWWAIGTAAAAGFAAALGTLAGRRTARFAVAALLPVPFELLASRMDGPAWAVSMVCSALAVAAVFALTRFGSGPAGIGPAGRGSGYFYPEGRAALGVHAVGAWAGAAVLAAVSAAQPETVSAAIAPALAVGFLAAAPALAARRTPANGLGLLAAVLAHGVPAGVVLTLAAPLVDSEGTLAVAVAAGAITILVSQLIAGGRRTAALIAGAAFAIPGALFAAGVCLPAVLGPLTWLEDPWTGAVDRVARESLDGPRLTATFSGSWPAFWSLAVIAGVAVALGLRRLPLLGIATAAIGLGTALIPLNTGSSVLVALVITTAAVVSGLLAGALVDRRQPGRGWALLPGVLAAAVPATGWAAVSVGASVITPVVLAGAAAAAAWISRSVPARAAHAGLAALLGVLFVGLATRAAGASLPAAGFAAVVASGVVVLMGASLLRAWPGIGEVFEYVGAATALVGAVVAAGATPWLAGALTALVPVALGAALRPDRRVVYGSAAGALALAAVWAWLAAARVDVVEAYTVPAAVLALAAGIMLWRNGPGRSWIALAPALVLGIGPTLLLGIGNNDVPRLIAAAVLAFAAVIVGAVLRLQAPLCVGAFALIAIGIDQWGDDIVRLPRWITLGVVGVLLMWIGATFEARRRDWRRASDVIGRFG